MIGECVAVRTVASAMPMTITR
jgi:hypothetical protein